MLLAASLKYYPRDMKKKQESIQMHVKREWILKVKNHHTHTDCTAVKTNKVQLHTTRLCAYMSQISRWEKEARHERTQYMIPFL